MTKIEPLDEGPIPRLFFAINHYISTGDHIGVGIAMPDPQSAECLIFIVPVQLQPEDESNWQALRSRVDQLDADLVTVLHYETEPSRGMDLWGLRVEKARIDELAAALTEKPGPLGWGSAKPIIDARDWKRP